MFNRLIPWKFLIKRAARAYGIIDPLTFLARIRQFSQPSEVQEPIELVRAGIAFHTRGLINTKAIQHNLDWVWPYWVEKQFNPNDNSFIPRAFSFSHVNLTHRNWTAVGHPNLPIYPIVDPRGLVTPLYDGWSLDFWIVTENGEKLLPSKLEEVKQQWHLSPNLCVETKSEKDKMQLTTSVQLKVHDEQPELEIKASGSSARDGWLVVALRPYNPEGIQFIEEVTQTNGRKGWRINTTDSVNFNRASGNMFFANYQAGDVVHMLDSADQATLVSCDVGMATAAALFPLPAKTTETIKVTIPLQEELERQRQTPDIQSPPQPVNDAWQSIISQTASLQVPDNTIQFLYDAALRTLILLSADDVFPGPYTYRRFWFRDACLMLKAMMATGLTDRAFSIINTFPERQKITGYFQSQKGEWDSNGQVLWIMDQFQQTTGQTLDPRWLKAVTKGADWIIRKRLKESTVTPHSGLLPPGFSAEHLGPNDFYYWDDFWSLAGLQSAARLCRLFAADESEKKYTEEAIDFKRDIYTSIDGIGEHRTKGGIPASPYRRMDAGAIGSMVADYPLQLTPIGDERIRNTAEYLMNNCFHKGAFFQDMIHSGTNIYLTLDIAQTLLRNGDPRYRQFIDTVAEMASPTGQWPEAIHPLTDGGCMGDGQHGWAAAEWLMMIRNLFVREEETTLIIGSGLYPEWIAPDTPLSFGPTATLFGTVEVRCHTTREGLKIELTTDYTTAALPPTAIIVAVPGYEKIISEDLERTTYVLQERQT